MAIEKKLLIFDLGGVVIDLHVERTFGAFVAMGVDASMLTETQCLMNRMILDYDRGDVATDDFFSYIESQLPPYVRELPSDELRERVADIWNMMLGDFSVEKIQRIKALKEEGYRVVLLSNTNETHWDVIERRMLRAAGCHINELFDALYLSYRMNMRKPEPEIFLELLRNEGVDATDAFFFDDSEANCDIARTLGIESMCLERNAAWPLF